MCYLAARGCTARAAVRPSWALPNQAFSSVCWAWANKTLCFAMVDDSGRSTAVVKTYSGPLAIKSSLWVLHCCGQAIFETPGASNHNSGCSTAVVKPYSRPMAHQITSFCSRSFKNCVFSHTKIHHTPLTSKSKEQRREQINFTIKTEM